MLENLLSGALLLAQRGNSSRLAAPTGWSSVPMLLGFGLLSLVVMAMIVAIVQYRQRRPAKGMLDSPSDLWAELCRVHQLEKTDSAALRELAEARALEPAASVFVRADLWQLERDTPELRHLRPQLQKLQGILFASSEPQPQVVRL